MSPIPQRGRWFVAAGVAFHATDHEVIDFADADDAPGEWVTIGGGPGPKGEQHVGGFPVKVTGGTPGPDGKLRGGTIVGGKLAARLGLHGKTTDQVTDHLAAVNAHRKTGKSLNEAVDAVKAAVGTRQPATGPRPRIWDHSPVYLTGCANAKVAAGLKGHAGFGILLTPATKGYKKYLKDFKQFGIDNGCYSKGGAFDEEAFLELVKSATEDPAIRRKCLFAVAPDVYDPKFDNGPGKSKGRGDPLKTIERSLSVLPKIRALGVPAALVAQDGLEDMVDKIPWDEFDVLFVGGSTEFKLLHHEDALRAVAADDNPNLSDAEKDRIALDENRNLKWLNLLWQVRAHGKTIHVGRVNSLARMAIAHAFGAESADGTFLAFGPDKNLPKIKKWMTAFADCAETADAIRAGRPLTADQQKTLDDLTGMKKPKGKRAVFAATVRGDLFGMLGARGFLGDFSVEGLRAVAAFLVRAAGSGLSVAVPAVRLLRLVRERIE